MAFETGETKLACRVCDAIHIARWDRLPLREEYHLKCKRCGSTLAIGMSVRDYGELRLAD